MLSGPDSPTSPWTVVPAPAVMPAPEPRLEEPASAEVWIPSPSGAEGSWIVSTTGAVSPPATPSPSPSPICSSPGGPLAGLIAPLVAAGGLARSVLPLLLTFATAGATALAGLRAVAGGLIAAAFAGFSLAGLAALLALAGLAFLTGLLARLAARRPRLSRLSARLLPAGLGLPARLAFLPLASFPGLPLARGLTGLAARLARLPLAGLTRLPLTRFAGLSLLAGLALFALLPLLPLLPLPRAALALGLGLLRLPHLLGQLPLGRHLVPGLLDRLAELADALLRRLLASAEPLRGLLGGGAEPLVARLLTGRGHLGGGLLQILGQRVAGGLGELVGARRQLAQVVGGLLELPLPDRLGRTPGDGVVLQGAGQGL